MGDEAVLGSFVWVIGHGFRTTRDGKVMRGPMIYVDNGTVDMSLLLSVTDMIAIRDVLGGLIADEEDNR